MMKVKMMIMMKSNISSPSSSSQIYQYRPDRHLGYNTAPRSRAVYYTLAAISV